MRKLMMLASGAALSLTLAACEKTMTAPAVGPTNSMTLDRAAASAARPHRAPFARLLEHRAEFGLSDAQVQRIQAIAAELRTKNEPLVAQLKAAGFGRERRHWRSLSDEEQPARRTQMEALRPVMRQMRENGRAAREQMANVLTDAQRDQLRAEVEARRSEHPRFRRRGRIG